VVEQQGTSSGSPEYLTLLNVGEVEQLWLNADHSKEQDTSPHSPEYLTLLNVGEVEQLWLNGDHSKDSEASPSSPAHLQKPRQRVQKVLTF
jgi:hypothetical protein